MDWRNSSSSSINTARKEYSPGGYVVQNASARAASATQEQPVHLNQTAAKSLPLPKPTRSTATHEKQLERLKLEKIALHKRIGTITVKCSNRSQEAGEQAMLASGSISCPSARLPGRSSPRTIKRCCVLQSYRCGHFCS